MKKIDLLLLIFVLTFTFSCDSDDDIDVSGIGYKLVKIETYRMPNDELKETTIFEYNQDGFVSKTIRNHYYSGTSITNYIYTNGKIRTIDYVDPDGSENFTYTDDLITSSIFTDVGLYSDYSYIYNSNNQVIKSVVSHYNSTTEYEVEYTYDIYNNVLSEDYVTLSYYSTYDSKNNPFRLVFPKALLKIKFIGQNNLLTNDFGNIITYEYNDNDYPSKQYHYYVGEFVTYSLYTYEEI